VEEIITISNDMLKKYQPLKIPIMASTCYKNVNFENFHSCKNAPIPSSLLSFPLSLQSLENDGMDKIYSLKKEKWFNRDEINQINFHLKGMCITTCEQFSEIKITQLILWLINGLLTYAMLVFG
jgi:hypothetical protein